MRKLDLTKPKDAAKYLTLALDCSKDYFMECLHEVILANGGLAKFAEHSGMARTNLYKMLSAQGNPTLNTMILLTEYLEIEIAFKEGRI